VGSRHREDLGTDHRDTSLTSEDRLLLYRSSAGMTTPNDEIKPSPVPQTEHTSQPLRTRTVDLGLETRAGQLSKTSDITVSPLHLGHDGSDTSRGVPDKIEDVTLAIADTEGLPSFSSFSQYSDESKFATSSITFPFTVSQLILDHTLSLEAYVQGLEGKYLFEAGYDVIPGDYKLLLNEQVECFQGTVSFSLPSSDIVIRVQRNALDYPICG
jgi:hypothetical protein